MPGSNFARFLDRKRLEETISGRLAVFGPKIFGSPRIGEVTSTLELSNGTVADGFLSENGLLADTVGDVGEFALIRTDGGEVVDLANNVQGAEGFPNLLVAGVDGGDIGAGGYVRAWRYEERADAPTDGGTNFGGLLSVLRSDRRAIDLQFCNEAALMDGSSHSIGVRNAAGVGGDDSGGL